MEIFTFLRAGGALSRIHLVPIDISRADALSALQFRNPADANVVTAGEDSRCGLRGGTHALVRGNPDSIQFSTLSVRVCSCRARHVY